LAALTRWVTGCTDILFTTLLVSPWRWVLASAAILLAIAFGSSCLDYASTWWARRQAAKMVHNTEASHDARVAAEPAQRSHFDSLLFTRIGQHPRQNQAPR
jgi:hypothetical protein